MHFDLLAVGRQSTRGRMVRKWVDRSKLERRIRSCKVRVKSLMFS